MTRNQRPPLEEEYEFEVDNAGLVSPIRRRRRGLLVNERISRPINLGDASLHALREKALQILRDAGLPTSPCDNLATRLRMRIEPLSQEHAAAVLVDAIDDVLSNSTVTTFAAIKLAGAYHQFMLVHYEINEDAVAGQKSAADLAEGPRRKKADTNRKAQILDAEMEKLFRAVPVFRGKGFREIAKELRERGCLRQTLLEEGLILEAR